MPEPHRSRRPIRSTRTTDAAYGLAATVADVLVDAELKAAVRADFEDQGGVLDVEGYFD